MQPSGEVGRFEVDDQPSPPADRNRYPTDWNTPSNNVKAVPLTPDDLTHQLAVNAVTIVLVVETFDPTSSALIKRLHHVATSFRTSIGFGWIDDSSEFSHPSIRPDDIAVTPVLLMFRGKTLLTTDATGRRQIELALTHENIDAIFGRTNGGAKLVE